MLPPQRCDPHIVVRDRSATLSQLGFDLTAKAPGYREIRKQNHRVCQKVSDVRELFLPTLCPLRAKVQFTENPLLIR